MIFSPGLFCSFPQPAGSTSAAEPRPSYNQPAINESRNRAAGIGRVPERKPVDPLSVGPSGIRPFHCLRGGEPLFICFGIFHLKKIIYGANL
jgi:hypothetical protein